MQSQTGRRVLVNTGALASSSLWRIAISFVLQILIARTLGISQLGQYISTLAFLNVAQIVSELGLPNLLVRDLAQLPHQRRAHFLAALRMQLASALLTWLALSGAACLLERTGQEPVVIEPISRADEGDMSNGMLRSETSGTPRHSDDDKAGRHTTGTE